jgi:uncharacterized membrane protein YqhA
MFFIGTVKTFKAFSSYFAIKAQGSGIGHVPAADLSTSSLIKSIDAFLIALVLMIFAYGVYSLFIRKIGVDEAGVFDWLKVSNVGHLKNILAELIIVILFVKFLEVAIINLNNLTWEMLILPASILLLALSLRFLKLRE